MSLLNDRVAFVTGGASGLGAAMARCFAQEGACVALVDVHQERGEQVRAEIVAAGGEALYISCDVTHAEQMNRAVNQTLERFGQLNIVCANAGINGVFAPIDELQPSEWEQTLNVNLKGTYLAVHFTVPHLKKSGGSIIVTSSINGNRNFAYPGAAAYCTSKAAQVTFMKMMAVELGQHNIRCNAICPGYIPSNLHENTTERNTKSLGIQGAHRHPAINNGVGMVHDLANAALFLASDLSSHVSGVELYVDGGSSLF